MTTQEVTIHPYVKVMMQSDAEVLEEVVIAVPYGTVKKANFSGSAAQVHLDGHTENVFGYSERRRG